MSVQTSPLAALPTLIGKEDGSAPVGRHIVGDDPLVSAQHPRHNPLDRESGTTVHMSVETRAGDFRGLQFWLERLPRRVLESLIGTEPRCRAAATGYCGIR